MLEFAGLITSRCPKGTLLRYIDPTIMTADPLEQGREAYRRQAWSEAFEALSITERSTPLLPDDLWLLATSAFLIGRDDDFLAHLERAHRTFLERGEVGRATRCAFWLGQRLAERGDMGQASGWLARARRLLEGAPESAEHGYLLLAGAQRQLGSGDLEAAYRNGAETVAIGERFGDDELVALALHLQGRARMRQARVDDGLALLDEAMIAVSGGELSPLVTGLIYCSVIAACREIYALHRANEWTAALSAWCETQPDLVPYAGQCLVHRAAVMQLQGAWLEAIDEARRASRGAFQQVERRAVAAAFYQQGELQRLRGAFAAAEEVYIEASDWGFEPQPGLALLRLAQGDPEAAGAAIRRALGETANPLKRAQLLPAHIEIALALGALDEARDACNELATVAQAYQTSALDTLAAHSQGAVELAAGDAKAALATLRQAWSGWQQLEAPFETARARMLVGQACRALGDDDTAVLEFDAARRLFAQLGAEPELARVEALLGAGKAGPEQGLTRRELEVLHLVAAGETNKAVAAALGISDRTVERHVSNIFDKLAVSSRAAATAYAYREKLI